MPSLPDLIQRLGASVQAVRDAASAELVAAGGEAVPLLREALSHGERDIRSGAALCLGSIGATEAASAICRMAEQDPDPSVRPLALRAVCDLSGPGAPAVIKRTLLAFLSSEDMFARALACTGIGRLQDPTFEVALKKALQDSEPWVREAAQKAMIELVAPALEVPAAAPSTALVVADEEALGPEVGHLVAQLGSPDLQQQQRAKEALIARGEAVIACLVPLLENDLAPGRRAAVEVLGTLAAPAGMPHLARLVEVAELRPSVLLAMSRILRAATEDPTVQQTFPAQRIQALLRDDPDQLVRAAAGAALICAGPQLRQIALGITAQDEEEWVLVAACRAAAEVVGPADEAVVPLLLDHLARLTEQDGRLEVLAALQRVLQDPAPDRDLGVVGPLSYFLHDEDPGTRLAAGLLISRVARAVDGPTLTGLLELLPLAEGRQRLLLVRELGRLGRADDAETIDGLGSVLRGRDLEAARAAAGALIALGGTLAIDMLVKAANSRQGQVVAVAAQALAAMDPRAEIIGHRLPDGRWERRIQHWCECGGELHWTSRQAHEELRCATCDREYVLSGAGKLFASDRTPLGICCCPDCRRKRPLIRQGTTDTLVCPSSGKVHVRPFDHPQQLRLLTDLPLGACSCCAEPQPLIRVDEQVICYRSRRPYRAEARGFALDRGDEEERQPVDDIDAINRALLEGTIGIGQSGVATGSGGDEET
jgi:HEAT repeat protein